MISPQTTKKDLNDLIWLSEHPEHEHRVVGIREFIDSPDYLNAKNECWPNIKDDLEDLDNSGCTEAVLCYAIGGGKSFASSILIVHRAYKVLCLKDPQKFFGLAKGSNIYFINMSIRAEQSKKVVFGEIKARIDNSPWFQKYNPPDPNIRSELIFPKGVVIFPGNSKEDFPLGYNIFGGVMDEAAFYTETESHDVAEDMFNALHSRIKNRFGDKGLLVMISSPRYVDDFIEKKIREAETNHMIFARRKKLWDSKPKRYFMEETIVVDGYEIPKDFEVEVKRNFDKFKRDFMAIPSLALEPYFKQWTLVEVAIDENLKHPIGPDGRFYDWFKGKPGCTYFGHIDLSLTTDATGISFCHKEGDRIIVDLIMKIKAAEGKEINIADVRGVVYELKARGFSIQKCTFDQFQSASSIQEFNNMGVNSERLSIDKDLACYETLKEAINMGRIKFYKNEDFLMELRRLELKEGKKVDHPKGGSKDLADAVSGAVYNCITTVVPSWGFAGGDRLKTPEETLKEQATYTLDSLVPYGFWRGRRLPG